MTNARTSTTRRLPSSRKWTGFAGARSRLLCILAGLMALLLGAGMLTRLNAKDATVVSINSDLVLVVNGQKVFPIGFTTGPPPGAKTPEGKNGMRELSEAGGMFMRTGSTGGRNWDEETIKREEKWLDAAAKNGMYCWPFLHELASIGPENPRREAMLREVINRFKKHPGLLVWKGADEPEWGKLPVEPLTRAYQIIKELDPHHPVVTIQAPRGTVESLRPYNAASDVIGTDIYPIGYPPGAHSLLPNKTFSLVGDHTRLIMEVAEGKLPVWMVLQVAWSGVVKPGKTLRMPTFPQERFMTYQAIINGARGVLYFGGNLTNAMAPADAKLGWNWTFWKRVLRPVVEEIGRNSPLHPALVAPDSKLPVRVFAGSGIEYCVREVGDEMFLLACKTSEPTEPVEFAGLPAAATVGEVLYESPRMVEAKNGRLTDWFAPYDVHVYRFKIGSGNQDAAPLQNPRKRK